MCVIFRVQERVGKVERRLCLILRAARSVSQCVFHSGRRCSQHSRAGEGKEGDAGREAFRTK